MEPTPQQIARWNSWRNSWISKIRPLTMQTIAICEYSAKLQVLLDGLNVTANVWDDTKTEDIKNIVNIYNRVDRAASKVELQTYGLRFNNGDFDIMAPASMTEEEIADDYVNLGGIFILIGIGMIVVGLALKVFEHLKSRDTIFINDQKLEIAKTIKEAGGTAPQIQAAIDNFNVENKDLVKKAGLFDMLFGEGSGMMIAAALGIGVLLFAYMKGRK